MTIGIVATKAFTKHKTGIENYTYNIIKHLLKIDNKNQYVLYINPKETSGIIQNSTFTSNHKKAIIKQLSWPFHFGWTQIRLSIEIFLNPPDILFAPSHLLPLYCPIKTTAVIHDVAFRQFPEVYSAKELYLQKTGAKRILKQAWKIIVPSQFTKDEIKKYYPKTNADKIYVIPHGYDKTIYKTDPNKSKTKTPYLLYIGRLESKKNTCRLIQAFNLIKEKSNQPSLKLILIGQPAYGSQDIKEEIDKSKYKNDIKETGWLTSREIAHYLKNALALVFPSIYEGFGLPILEAMACGCPIICSDIGVFREIAKGAVLYFNPFDVNNMTSVITQVIHDRDLQNKMKQKGLEVVKNYDWHKTAEKTIRLFE